VSTARPTAPERVRNRLLASLSPPERERLWPHLERVTLKPRQVLHHWGTPMTQVYFVEHGLVSVTAHLDRTAAVEVWLIGREGMTGVPVVLGGDAAPPHRRVVQVGGSAWRIAADDLRRLMSESAALRAALLRYAQVILLQTSQLGACNAHHSLQQRLARWLLMARDGLGGDEVALTHRVLARLLGVRRASVTECLSVLADKGALKTGRGRIRTADREALEALSCDCHRPIRHEYERLLGCPGGPEPAQERAQARATGPLGPHPEDRGREAGPER